MNREAIRALAKFLTGQEVSIAQAGITMERNGAMKSRERAERFFELRGAFNLKGANTPIEAEIEIIATLEKQ